MAYSSQSAVSDGTLQTLILSIAFFDKTEIAVFRNGTLLSVNVDYVWATANSIQFPSPQAAGVTVLIVRTTDISTMRHVFTEGAAFSNKTLDENYTQNLHIAQEAVEGRGLSQVNNDLNMLGHRIVNMGDAVSPGDAVTLRQLQTASFDSAAQLRADLLSSTGAKRVTFLGPRTGEVAITIDSLFGSIVDVKRFGAVGDGIADDTAAIQAALDSFPTSTLDIVSSGGSVYLSQGVFKITAALRRPLGVSIIGSGALSTRLYTTTAGLDMITIKSGIPTGSHMLGTIRGIMFDGGVADETAGGSRVARSAIDAGGMNNSTVRDCVFKRFTGSGIRSRTLVVEFNVYTSYFQANARPWDHAGGLSTTIRYIECNASFNDLGGIFDDIAIVSLVTTIVEKNGGVGIYQTGASASIIILNSYFEDNLVAHVQLDNGVSADINLSYFTYTANKGPGFSQIFVGSCTNVSLVGNLFNGSSVGNGGSADIAASAGPANSIYTSNNKHIGTMSRTSSLADARLWGDRYNIVRGATPGAEYQDAAGTALHKVIVTGSNADYRHAAATRFSDMAGTYRVQVDASGLVVSGGGWNTGHLQLGNTHLWVDGSAKLRIKFGVPTSDTDGVVVGTQA